MGQVRIKICGVTNEADGRHAALQGADAIGLNFYPQSPRYIAPDLAEYIVRELPPFTDPVALFVNQPLRMVFQALNALGSVRTFQWHGTPPELSDPYPFRMIVAFPVRDQQSLDGITRYLQVAEGLGKRPAAILVDAQVPGMYGGTGQQAPWSLLAGFRPSVPLILAGGLTPENVAEAIRVVRPHGVDVASGVESGPGQKDPEKVKRFIQTAREAAARWL